MNCQSFSPRCHTYFNKRTCLVYVEDPITLVCSGCERKKSEHYEFSDDPNKEWNYQECTNLSPTDAYGILNFPGSYSKTARYIRVEVETRPSDLLQYMYCQEGWKLQKPQLILNVTGGSQKFMLPQNMKKAFKRGLIKVASSTGAWIITGGANTGVMRLVGEAVAEEFHKNSKQKITVLGIVNWGKIALKNEMIIQNQSKSGSKDSLSQHGQGKVILYAKKINEISKEESSKIAKHTSLPLTNDVYLETNHTHFILVDDGSTGKNHNEIQFRTRFQAELRRGKGLKFYEQKSIEPEIDDLKSKIPIISIVVQGGQNTLITVEQSIQQNIPILVLADSKGCADLIVNAYNLPRVTDNALSNLLIESAIFDKYKGADEYEGKIEDAVKLLKEIIKKRNLINIFRLDNEEDIEMTILSAFLNLKKNQHYENLKLALRWNRDDIAKSYIFTGEEEFKSWQLAALMETALIQNKPKFVELLLDNGLDLRSFLTVKRLLFLYNSEKVQQLAKKAPLFQLYKRKSISSKNTYLITFSGIRKFLKEFLYDDFKPKFIENFGRDIDFNQIVLFIKNANKMDSSNVSFKELDRDKFTAEVEYPEKNLFVWAILLNRIDMAKIFWQLGEHQIITALFASNILKSMAEHFGDLENELVAQADEFEEMACGVLDVFDNQADDLIKAVILLQKIPYYEIDSLQMAVQANCLKFISLPTVQNLLTDIWNGKLDHKTGHKHNLLFGLSIVSLGFLAPLLLFNQKSGLPKQNNYDYTLQNLDLSIDNKTNFKRLLKSYYINDEMSLRKIESNILPQCCYKSSPQTYLDSNQDEDIIQEGGEEMERLFSETEKEGLRIQVKDESEIFQEPKLSRFEIYWKRYQLFVGSPKVHFIYETIFYIIFLALFSYMLLCDFKYKLIQNSTPDQEQNLTFNENFTNKSEKTSLNESYVERPSVIEILVTIWIFFYLIEEFRQFIFNPKETTIRNKVYRYFNSVWNLIDFCACLIFLNGFALRIISSLTKNENLFIAARIIYAFDLTIWYFRLLHIATVFKSLGPKLVMIQKMIYDLLFFIIIIIIFVFSFGITTQATMYPGNSFDIHLIKNMINKAYWPIYGDMKILEELNDENGKCEPESNCAEPSGKLYSYIALMVYMIIANVLLINLLIAMFRSSLFPPPLTVLAYIASFAECINKLRKESLDKEYPEDGKELQLEKKFTVKYLRNKYDLERESFEFKLKSNAEKFEALDQKLNEIIRLKTNEE